MSAWIVRKAGAGAGAGGRGREGLYYLSIGPPVETTLLLPSQACHGRAGAERGRRRRASEP